MNQNIRKLMDLMPPHEGAGDAIDWHRTREVWGCDFPSDFRDFMTVYGSGTIEDGLAISRQNEGAPGDGPYDVWFVPSPDWLEDVSAPYPAWPTEGSLICWGEDANQNLMCWSTRGSDPDKWPVAVWDSGGLDGEAFIEFDCGMAELLLRIFSDEQPYPFSEGFLGGVTCPRFVHRKEEARLRGLGIDPWPDA